MRRITAEISPAIHWVSRLLQVFQISAVCVVHKKNRSVFSTDLGERSYVCFIPEVIRTRDIHRGRCSLRIPEHLFQVFRSDMAPQQVFSGSHPLHIDIQKRRRLQKNPVSISPCSNRCSASPHFRVHPGKEKHGPDAERRALGRIDGSRAPEELCRILFTLANHIMGIVQDICAFDLCDIKRLNPRPTVLRAFHTGASGTGAFPFMPWHVKASQLRRSVAADKITDRRVHFTCSARSARAAASMIAHSILFLNSSHPSSYTPVMLPVACHAFAAHPPEQ